MDHIAALSIATLAFFGVMKLALHAGPSQRIEQINYPDWGPPDINEQEDT